MYVVVCSDTFANCNECRDYNGNDQIDTGECSSCTDGYMLNDDKDKCLCKLVAVVTIVF